MTHVETYGQFEGVKCKEGEEDARERMFLKTVERLAPYAQVLHDIVHL